MNTRRHPHTKLAWLLSTLVAIGCETAAPTPTPTADASPDVVTDASPDVVTDASPDVTADVTADAPADAPADVTSDVTADVAADVTADVAADAPADVTADAPADAPAPACMALASDYTPRVMMSATDTWPACVSDPGLYVRFSTSTSSITRTAAFERMNLDPTNGRPAGLFDPRRDPTPEEFTAARMVYLEPEGLDSRLVRRADEHYPQPTPSNDCRVDTVRAANPDYCAGPMRLLPIVNDSFRDGQLGTSGTPQRVLAARIEAAIVWFLNISTYKESLTCTAVTDDCDSAWAYYTGGVQRADAMHVGLSRRVRDAEPATHDRIWDGLLAVRCWRTLDAATPATDTALRERARAQLDAALTRGVVAVFEARLRAMAAATGAERDAHFAFVKVLAPLLDRAVRARDADAADTLRAQLAATAPAGVDASRVIAALERALPCP
jgi:hypothetical protein